MHFLCNYIDTDALDPSNFNYMYIMNIYCRTLFFFYFTTCVLLVPKCTKLYSQGNKSCMILSRARIYSGARVPDTPLPHVKFKLHCI